jgi:hypothetical protein
MHPLQVNVLCDVYALRKIHIAVAGQAGVSHQWLDLLRKFEGKYLAFDIILFLFCRDYLRITRFLLLCSDLILQKIQRRI